MKEYDTNPFPSRTLDIKKTIHKGFKSPKRKGRRAKPHHPSETVSIFSTEENTPTKTLSPSNTLSLPLSHLFFPMPPSRPFNTSAFKFEFLIVLGKGAFGDVFLVRDSSQQKLFALKSLSKAHLIAHKQIEHVKNEVNILSKISHPFIVE